MITRCTIDKGKYKTLSAKYNAGALDTTPLENLKEVREWQNEYYDSIRKLPKEVAIPIFHRDILKYGDHRKDYMKIFGKPDFYWTGEFRFHCYCLELKDDNPNGIRVLVMTASTKGTCYELIKEKGVPTRTDLAIDFFEEITTLLEECEKGIITDFNDFKK